MNPNNTAKLSNHPLTSVIGRRIILILVIISSCITLLSTLMQLYFDYSYEVDAVHTRHEELKQVHVESLAINLWEFNEAQLQLRIEGLVRLPNLEYIQVRSNTGNQQWSSGEAVKGDKFSSHYPLIYKGPGTEAPFSLGELYVESSAERIYQQLIKKFASLLLINGIKTFIVSGLILWVFHLSVNRRIMTILRYLERYRPSQSHIPLKLDKPKYITSSHQDELDVLSVAINQLSAMLNNLYAEIEQEKSRFSDFANVASDWLWETDTNGELIFVSEQMQQQLGSNKNFSQLPLTDLFPSQRAQLEQLLVQKQDFRNIEIPIVLDEITHYFLFNGLRQTNEFNTFTGFRGTAVDITVRKVAENALQELNDSLEQRVIERTQQLKDSLEQLQVTQQQLIEREKMASLSGLVAGIAHEINTPLGVAITAGSLLEPESSNTEQKEVYDLMQSSLQRVVKLVHTFKQTAVQSSNARVENINIKSFISDLAVGIQHNLLQKHVTLEIEGDEQLEWQTVPSSWAQIISQFINNSLEHGFSAPDQGSSQENMIHLNLQQEGDELVFTYSDNGKGMALETLEKLFEPFYTTKRGSGCTGLGMHIVFNQVTQVLQGHIEATSSEQSGICIVIRAPRLELNTDQNSH
ncbi:His Kinase A (phospho-acceptor) domain-containing protein [Oceanospirillum multiglobuliferum]|uniref:histidine kinase n=1 Tax=Oceanospirillum multiglobuliferum TaxID=64969 RepID=A0A1T4KWC6_9GAMM|nr:ATP-binding protein [Oceanospirillum multiglobuliferum]OPX54979.1 hypothetical protein BTE48_11615 [Oceanospirillum multiglobuliferum]SJZ46729.1 His Kinase A (phospho-acceptor) domain-containing protein [Oceanospirillum multiglobuliferum]